MAKQMASSMEEIYENMCDMISAGKRERAPSSCLLVAETARLEQNQHLDHVEETVQRGQTSMWVYSCGWEMSGERGA